MPRSLLVLAIFCCPWLTSAQSDQSVDDKELKPLARAFADYFESRDLGAGSDEARLKLENQVTAVLGTAPSSEGLGNTASLERAVWLSHGYDRTRLRKGKIESFQSPRGSGSTGTVNYSYRVPREYEPERVAYPLVLAIPGDGERTDEHIRTHWSSREFREGAIIVCPEMPETVEEWDRAMVDGRPGGLTHVFTALRLAGERFAIDFDRIYIAGRDKSVPAAVAAGNVSPQRFAGVIGRAGDPGELPAHNFLNLPTLFHGAGAGARDFQKTTQESGFDNCKLDPVGKEVDVWNWMVARPRNTYPVEARVIEGLAYPTRTYWLGTSAMAPNAHATATIERETNTVRVECEGVSHITLYLNDKLVDLNRPVTIVRNKVESSFTIPRSLPIALDLLRNGMSDSACVYVAEAVFDMRSADSGPQEDSSAQDKEYRERLASAAGDPAALWELHLWCQESARSYASRSVLIRIVRIDSEHAKARAALGHEKSGGQWFTTSTALERYREIQDEVIAKQRGYVKHRDIWMHPDERALASKGLVKDQESGRWLTAAERRRLSQGWARMDLQWIAPDEAGKIDDGLWLVDGEWIELAEANRRHSRIDRMWSIPTADVLLHTTAEREVARRAIVQMSRALKDLRRVFGAEPALPLEVAMLSYEEQYDRFAFGAADGRRAPTHAGRLHVIHSAYFAESWFRPVGRKREFSGMGVCYWNANAPYGDAYGLHSARLAMGLSFVDALDPSPKAIQHAESEGTGEGYYAAYQEEKTLPVWLRYGGAVYAERYFHDDTVAEDGDPWWARRWSLGNLRGRGGLRELDAVFEFRLDPANPDDGLKLLIESGLIVAFMLDGNCEPVMATHAELKNALRSGRPNEKHFEALEAALRASEDELKTFAAG